MVVTSQCLRGRICDRVYDTGRYMLDAGAIEGEDMLPEVALVKLMWVLANRARMMFVRSMKTPLAGEISFSTPMTVVRCKSRSRPNLINKVNSAHNLRIIGGICFDTQASKHV